MSLISITLRHSHQSELQTQRRLPQRRTPLKLLHAINALQSPYRRDPPASSPELRTQSSSSSHLHEQIRNWDLTLPLPSCHRHRCPHQRSTRSPPIVRSIVSLNLLVLVVQRFSDLRSESERLVQRRTRVSTVIRVLRDQVRCVSTTGSIRGRNVRLLQNFTPTLIGLT